MNSTQASDFLLDQRLVLRSFEKAAQNYDKSAVVQHEVGQRMLDRLELIRLQPERIFDIGTGTGRCCAMLAERYASAQVTGVDLSLNMLRLARDRIPWRPLRRSRLAYVCGDANQLPLRKASADMLFSNLMFQWCNDLDHLLRQLRPLLRREGLLMFSTFGPDTLKELRTCWQDVDDYTHVNAFMDMHDIGDALVRTGFDAPVLDVDRIVVTYPDLTTLMTDLKTLGAHNVTAGRRRGLTGKGRLAAVQEAYDKLRVDGRLPATYEIIYGHAWQANDAIHGSGGGYNQVKIPVSKIGARRESGKD